MWVLTDLARWQDSLKEQGYKDTTMIMQLIKDNLELWNLTEDEDLEVTEIA